MPQQQNKERLLVFTADGDMRFDSSAVKFHDSILSYKYALGFPARSPTRRWSYREEGRQPVSDGSMYVETTPPQDPGMDGEFLLKTIPSMWTSAYMGQTPRRWRLGVVPPSYIGHVYHGSLADHGHDLVHGNQDGGGGGLASSADPCTGGVLHRPAGSFPWAFSRHNGQREARGSPEEDGPMAVAETKAETVLDQAWIDEQVQKARYDVKPTIVRYTQAFMNPYTLYRRWKLLGDVTNSKVDRFGVFVKTFGLYVLVSLVGSLALMITVNAPWWAALALPVLLSPAAAVGAFVFVVFRQTYIQAFAMERRTMGDSGAYTDMTTVWLPRLALYHHQNCIGGSDGHTGIMDPKAYVRLRVSPGETATGIRSFAQFYEYDIDNEGMRETAAKNRFNHIHLALRSGEENQEPDKEEDFAACTGFSTSISLSASLYWPCSSPSFPTFDPWPKDTTSTIGV